MTEKEICNFCKEHDVKISFEYDISLGETVTMEKDGLSSSYTINPKDIRFSANYVFTLRMILYRLLNNLEPQKLHII